MPLNIFISNGLRTVHGVCLHLQTIMALLARAEWMYGLKRPKSAGQLRNLVDSKAIQLVASVIVNGSCSAFNVMSRLLRAPCSTIAFRTRRPSPTKCRNGLCTCGVCACDMFTDRQREL